MNPRLKLLMEIAIQEENKRLTDDQRKEKICIIQDICKAKKLLFGLGQDAHDEFLSDKKIVELFDELYDYDLTQLRMLNSIYADRLTAVAHAKVQQT